MKIGIFGGTFNPIHKGHIEILEDIKKKIGLDLIYIIPTYQTPDKSFDVEKISALNRYNIVKNALKDYNYKWIKLSNVELKRKGISYTIDTVMHFKNSHPNDELFLIMGDDRYDNFEKWKNYDEIEKYTKLIVYKRIGLNEKKLLNSNKVIYLNDKTYDYSSSEILSNLDLEKIPKNALKYISKNNLYLKRMVFDKLYEKRYDHSLSVASHAKRLAKKNHLNQTHEAYIAGLVHDIFKYEDYSWMVNYISKNSDYIIPEKPALHGYAAAIWLNKEYGLKDKKIINAIKKHTIPDDKMSKLDKIIYVADKISNDRKGKEIAHLRKMAYYDLELTFQKLLKKQVKKLEEKNIKVDETTLKAYKKYVSKK